MNRLQLIEQGTRLSEVVDWEKLREQYRVWKEAVLRYERENFTGGRLRLLTHMEDTPYGSKEEKVKQYHTGIRQIVLYLQDIPDQKEKDADALETLVKNFGLYLHAMFITKPENQSTIKKDLLEQIEIKNEYDVQHMMYAVIKALYPSARREVNQDTGYGTVRYDIVIEDIDTVIEIKCTREDHNERKLFAELGQDGFFYKCARLIVYVYDKHKKIQDIGNFARALERTKETAGKEVKVYVEQAKDLI